MTVTDREMEHARKRVAEMDESQLLTRLNRITKPEKLHAFSAAVAERLEACKSEREVKRYYFVLARIDERRSSNTLDLDYYLGKFRAWGGSISSKKPKVKEVIVQPVIQLPKIKKKVSRRNLGI